MQEANDAEIVKPEHRRNSILSGKIAYEHSDDDKSSEEGANVEVEIEYFDGHGRAEPIRMMLFALGVGFTNKYVSQEEWPTLKPNKELYPNGGLPVVSINKKRYYQTAATMRSLAMGLGAYETSDHFGCYVHDALMDEYGSCLDASGAVLFAQDDETRNAAL